MSYHYTKPNQIKLQAKFPKLDRSQNPLYMITDNMIIMYV